MNRKPLLTIGITTREDAILSCVYLRKRVPTRLAPAY